MKDQSKSIKLLLALEGLTDYLSGSLEAFLFSYGSAKQLNKNLNMLNSEYRSTFDGLKRHGYIKKVNEDQFLITPKAVRKIQIAKIESTDWSKAKWDGFWRITAFDIPEPKKQERNILRSVLKRIGFVGIQNSVFIAPFADFDALAKLRDSLGIAKYVSFFEAKSSQTDDDTALKKRFNLK